MMPLKFSRSLSKCRSWLFSQGPARVRSSRRSPSRPQFFRPQLSPLEDRCLLTTVISLSGDSAIFNRGTLSGAPSLMAQWAVDAIQSQPAGQQFVIVVGANWGNLGVPIGFATITPTGTPGEYSCTFYPTGPLGAADTQPPAPPSAPFVILVPQPPPPTTPPPKASQGEQPGPAVSWWSQTSHPGVGVLFVLPGSISTVSSLPVGQASTPVVLFLPQQIPVAGEIKIARPIAQINVSDAMVEALASRSLNSAAQQSRAALTLANFQSPGRACEELNPFIGEGAGKQNLLPDESFAVAAPSRQELLALTSKIVKENDAEEEAEDDSRRTLTLKAIAVCAAVQTIWLGLRQLATTRARQFPDRGNEKRSWLWKRIAGQNFGGVRD